MKPAPQTPSQGYGKSFVAPFRAPFADAIRFWERRRLIYNIVLAAVVLAWLVATWPHFRQALTLSSLLLLVILALLANACYCAAYLVDIPMQRSFPNRVSRRLRWGLWLLGTLFAIVLANYWIADEIYPFLP
jgi:Mn2+/Fe2+ NRAMP family transporter